MDFTTIPILDLSLADSPDTRPKLQAQLRHALFDTGFLYITHHGVPQATIDALTSRIPALFALDPSAKRALSKSNSPAFLGYSGFAEEITQGARDLREQFDFATEPPASWATGADTAVPAKPYWNLYGRNQWPPEEDASASGLRGFRAAFEAYHDAVASLGVRFVHLVESTLGMAPGTYDSFFADKGDSNSNGTTSSPPLPPPYAQHRIKLLSYPSSPDGASAGQGVGAHKDSSGWITFLAQVGTTEALEVVNARGEWIPAPPVPGSFVVNFGNALEAATEGAVRATIHRVRATPAGAPPRHSIAFFQGLPLGMTVAQVRAAVPAEVRRRAREARDEKDVASFLDARWDGLGESQLRKWMRSHEDVARRWYDRATVEFYLS